jgi:hypothetical protein
MVPLTFARSAFVSVSIVPPWLRTFAGHAPVILAVDAVRDLLPGRPVAGEVHARVV